MGQRITRAKAKIKAARSAAQCAAGSVPARPGPARGTSAAGSQGPRSAAGGLAPGPGRGARRRAHPPQSDRDSRAPGRLDPAPGAGRGDVPCRRPHDDHVAASATSSMTGADNPENTVPTSSVTSIMAGCDTSAQSATTESATEPMARRTPGSRQECASLSAQPACSCAKSTAPSFAARVAKCELRELALGRRTAVPLPEPRRAAAQVRGLSNVRRLRLDRRLTCRFHALDRAKDCCRAASPVTAQFWHPTGWSPANG